MAEKELKFQIADKMSAVFEGPARYRGAHGGRGSAKSWGFARKALQRMVLAQLAGKKCRILCARELQNSIKDSVLQLLIDQIELLGLQDFFDYGESYLRGIDSRSDFLFKGLRHNIKEIKSTEAVDVTWIEEAETVSEETFRVLPATVFRTEGSEVWLSWNPESKDAPIQKRFIDTCPADAKIVEVNYIDNPWFPIGMELERQDDLKRYPDLYSHIWLGQCLTRTDAQVLGGKWRIDKFHRPEELDGGPYYGCDWGYSSDPLALVVCWIKGNTLYIDQEAGRKGVEIGDTPAMFDTVPGIKDHTIRADNARPELISHMQTAGYKVIGAEKWPGSVEDGITHLRSYDEIVIHERCVNVAKEARLWSWKIDKQTGDILPVLLPANDHWMDGVRYALAPIIRKKKHTGKAIYAGQWNQALHVSHEELWPIKNQPLIIGIAIINTTPCAVIGQMTARGQLRIIEEVIVEDMGVSQFAKSKLRPMLSGKYRGLKYSLISFRDRTSTRTTDTDERLILDEMEAAGFDIDSVNSDLLGRRLEAVRWFLGALTDGRPSIIVSPTCTTICDGFLGGYQYKRLIQQDGDDERFTPDPDKNKYVKPHEALQYLCMHVRGDIEDRREQPIIVGQRTYS